MLNRNRNLKFILIVMIMLTIVVIGNAFASSPAELPLITASQASYATGATATILGYEFEPGTELVIEITNPNGKTSSGTAVANAEGEIVYDYKIGRSGGMYSVTAIDSSTVSGKGKNQTEGVTLANTGFTGNVNTDLEMVGMPDVSIYRPVPPPRSGPRDGLVDAIAGLCLVGTVDINAVGQTSDIRGFYFDLVIDNESQQQGPTPVLMPFIDQLETVGTAVTADPDTGSAPAPDGLFYTTSGNSVIIGPVQLTSLDGTLFDVTGPTTPGPAAGEMVYQVTVSPSNFAALTDTRFEYCARINPNAGDSDNGTDGFVTSSPETGGTETSPINVIQITEDDTDDPICVIESIVEVPPPVTITVFTEDSQSGIVSIEVLTLVNGTVEIPRGSGDFYNQGDIVGFNPPRRIATYVEGIKTDPNTGAHLALRVTDAFGNVSECDPVHTVVIREQGKPVSETYTGVLEAESIVSISNGAPGLSNLDIEVNGQTFDVSGLSDGGETTLDVSTAMIEGANNIFTLTAYGQPGASATILIWEGE